MEAAANIEWVDRALQDLTYRSPFGVVWNYSSKELPIKVTISPADLPKVTLVFEGWPRQMNEYRVLAFEIQALLGALFSDHEHPGMPTRIMIPECPLHEHALVAGERDNLPAWVCPESEWSCRFGSYEDSFWPFPSDASPGDVSGGVYRRLHASGVKWSGTSTMDKDGDDWVFCMNPQLRDDSPESIEKMLQAVSDAISPVRVKIDRVIVEQTVRFRKDAEFGDPGYECLRSTGISQLARLQGVLRRPLPGEDADIVIELSPGQRTWVRLGLEHTKSSTSPFLLDGSGSPFADDGDLVVLGGGFSPSRFNDVPATFFAKSIERPD